MSKPPSNAGSNCTSRGMALSSMNTEPVLGSTVMPAGLWIPRWAMSNRAVAFRPGRPLLSAVNASNRRPERTNRRPRRPSKATLRASAPGRSSASMPAGSAVCVRNSTVEGPSAGVTMNERARGENVRPSGFPMASRGCVIRRATRGRRSTGAPLAARGGSVAPRATAKASMPSARPRPNSNLFADTVTLRPTGELALVV